MYNEIAFGLIGFLGVGFGYVVGKGRWPNEETKESMDHLYLRHNIIEAISKFLHYRNTELLLQVDNLNCYLETLTNQRQLHHPSCCVVCLHKAATFALVPCGHRAYCQDCCRLIQTCCVCRSSILGCVRIYQAV
jgi:hypothetical protein